MQGMIFVNFKRLHEKAIAPKYATEFSVGMDLFCHSDFEMAPGETILIGVGWAIELPAGAGAQIRPRSGLSTKRLLLFPNSIGTIDTDYRGELKVPLFNASKELQTISTGTAIGQLLIDFPPRIYPCFVDDLSDTARGAGGFGSTGNC